MNQHCIARAAFALVAASAGAACARVPPAAPPAPVAADSPAPMAEAPAPAATPGVIADSRRLVKTCVVRNGAMEMVDADYDPATGDTTVNGRPFREAYPATAEHAAGARWYVDNLNVSFAGFSYWKVGLPRVFGPTELLPVGSYQGVGVFTTPRERPGSPVIIFLAVYPNCQFQEYQREMGQEVRG
jgi:hypothetical protein